MIQETAIQAEDKQLNLLYLIQMQMHQLFGLEVKMKTNTVAATNAPSQDDFLLESFDAVAP